MVEETVTIVVKDRGTAATARGIKRVGSASRKAKVAVAALVSALGGFLAIRGLTRLGGDAIKAAAGFEQFGIRLGALLGSQKEANVALGNFIDLAAKTPFSVSQIVEGASALGAAALGNRDALESLTQQAANLAATTGISFVEAANNLQRALSAGIGAADLFRDRGVRALIESIGGIPDATKLSTDELKALFEEVFGEGGVFGDQAEALANTLGGALSNIEDAATNAKVALGQAFAPAVVGGARQALIPFLQNLEKLIKDNDEEIRAFASAFIKLLVPTIGAVIRAGILLVESFTSVGNLGLTLGGIMGQISINFSETALAILELGNAIGLVSDEKIEDQKRKLIGLNSALDELANESRLAEEGQQELAAGFAAVTAQVVALESAIARADLETRAEGPKDVVLPTTIAPDESEEQIRARESAEKKVLQITNAIKVSSAARIDQLDGQVVRLEQQAQKLRDAAIAANDIKSADEGILLIAQQISQVRQEQADLRAKELEDAAKIRSEAAKEIGGSALEALRTDGASILDELAENAEAQFAEAFGEAILSIGDALEDVFSEAFENIDFGSLFEGQGENIGKGLSAAVGIGASLLARELEGTTARSRNDLVKSAVQNAQATRGVVAGPTSIPIFQIGQKLEDAMIPTNGILVDILAAVSIQPASGGGGIGGGAAGGGASGDLSLTTPSLV